MLRLGPQLVEIGRFPILGAVYLLAVGQQVHSVHGHVRHAASGHKLLRLSSGFRGGEGEAQGFRLQIAQDGAVLGERHRLPGQARRRGVRQDGAARIGAHHDAAPGRIHEVGPAVGREVLLVAVLVDKGVAARVRVVRVVVHGEPAPGVVAEGVADGVHRRGCAPVFPQKGHVIGFQRPVVDRQRHGFRGVLIGLLQAGDFVPLELDPNIVLPPGDDELIQLRLRRPDPFFDHGLGRGGGDVVHLYPVRQGPKEGVHPLLVEPGRLDVNEGQPLRLRQYDLRFALYMHPGGVVSNVHHVGLRAAKRLVQIPVRFCRFSRFLGLFDHLSVVLPDDEGLLRRGLAPNAYQ